MQRRVFAEEHEDFRLLARDVIATRVVPEYADWEAAGQPPRKFYQELGELGILGINVPTQYGGSGESSYLYSAVLTEETMRALVALGALRVHMDIVLPYFLHFADDDQRARWLPGFASGELMTAIAMTEPGTGSDLAGIRTTATLDGDHYVINGAKTFITGGAHADLVIVVARTSESTDNRRDGLSLIVVERGRPGFEVGPPLSKLGLKAQDTVELSFSDVRVPVTNRLGDEGRGFEYLGANLPQERLSIAVGSVASARAVLDLTVDHVRQRAMFGKHLSDFQNTKFVLADCATSIEAAQSLVDQALREHEAGELSPVDAAKVKLFVSEVQAEVVDQCLQLFGGYGYMTEYPISRLYADARITRIYGGTSEVMKTIIARSLGL